MEERLPGGRNDGAVRAGDTVRRRTGDHTPGVHALLRHLHAVGFSRAPRVLGIDDQGREVLTFLAGETVGDARPWPGWAHSDGALVAVGRWLRDFHAASASFVPPVGARWFGDHDEVRPGEVVGHHDAAPYNAVWAPVSTPRSGDEVGDPQDVAGRGVLVGFVDWDLAGPSTPLKDLAFVVLTWVPLTAREVAVGDGFPVAVRDVDRAVEQGRRVRLLLDAYGWAGSVEDVLVAVRRRSAEHAEGLRAAAQRGHPPAVALVAEGVAEDFDRVVAELDAGHDRLLEASAPAPGRWGPAGVSQRPGQRENSWSG